MSKKLKLITYGGIAVLVIIAIVISSTLLWPSEPEPVQNRVLFANITTAIKVEDVSNFTVNDFDTSTPSIDQKLLLLCSMVTHLLTTTT